MTRDSDGDERRAEWWASRFRKFNKNLPERGPPQHVAALEIVHSLMILMNDPATKQDEKLLWNAATEILTLWQLLSAEIGQYVIEAFSANGFLPDIDNPSLDRVRFQFLLKLQAENVSALHQGGLDPAAILLPRWFLDELSASLKALDKGDVPPIFAPFSTGQHGPIYHWDLARCRALEHVAYLVGQGVGKGIAQRRVATAMRKVSDQTLKGWERTMRPDPDVKKNMAWAKQAGQITGERSANPDDKNAGPIDAVVLHKLRQLEDEPLAEFGRRYDAEFGRRHNSG